MTHVCDDIVRWRMPAISECQESGEGAHSTQRKSRMSGILCHCEDYLSEDG